MDAEGFDWNQQEKQKLIKTNPVLELFIRTVIILFFWLSLFVFIYLFWFKEVWVAIYFLIAYGLVFAMAILAPSVRLYGQVLLSEDNSPLGDALLELSPVSLPNVVFCKTHTTKNGKFFIRAQPGKYNLVLKTVSFSGEIKILKSWVLSLGELSFCNKNLYV
jgi:hypothetical protein